MDDVAERGGVNVDLRGVEAEEDDVCVRFEIGIAVEILLPLSIFLNGLCAVLLKVAGDDAVVSLRALADVERITTASAITALAVAEASPGEMKEEDGDGDSLLADKGAVAVVVAPTESLFIAVCSPSSFKVDVEDADDMILSSPTNFFSGIFDPSFSTFPASLSPSPSMKPTLFFSTIFSFFHFIPMVSFPSVLVLLVAFEVLLSLLLLLLLNDKDAAFVSFLPTGPIDA